MLDIPRNMIRTGRCMNCGFAGVLLKKAMIRPTDLNSVTGDTSDAVPTLSVCLTCFETPAGCESANITHKRE